MDRAVGERQAIEDVRFGRTAAWRGVTALAIVAVVALGGGVALFMEARFQAELASDVNDAGRQRMLTQRIAVAAAGGDLDRVDDSVAWLEEVHRHLMEDAVVPFSELVDPATHDDLMDYIELAQTAAAGDRGALAALPAEAEDMLPSIDDAVTDYEQLAAERMARLQIWVLVGSLATMLAAALAWFGVARPGLQALRASVNETHRSAELAFVRLERLARQVAFRDAMTELSFRVLATDDLDELLTAGTELIRDTVDADWCYVIEVTAPREIRVRSSAGESCSNDGEQEPEHLDELPQVGYTLMSRTPLLVGDLTAEHRFRTPDRPTRRGMRSSMSAVIPGRRAPFGVLCVHSRHVDQFTRDDLEFVTTAAMLIGSLIERLLAERAAIEQQEQYLRVTQNANDLIFRYQLEPVRRCLYVNDAIQDLLGHPPEDWYADPRLLDSLRSAAGDDTELWPASGERRAVIAVLHREGGIRRLELELTAVPSFEDDGVIVEGIGRDITERERAGRLLEQALDQERRAAEELRQLAELKDTFLAAVSHELRTPLTVITGVAETLGQYQTELTDGQQHQLLDRLQANASKLDQLLEDLLDLERLTQQQTAPEREQLDVAAVVAHCLEEVELDGRTVVSDLAPVHARVDRSMLERIVVNLVGNAVKHTPPETRIWVRLTSYDDVFELTVADQGPGIPADLRERVFEPFHHGPSAPIHAPGHGIGLTLVRRFAELQHGRAWVDEAPGGGAAFHVELPIE